VYLDLLKDCCGIVLPRPVKTLPPQQKNVIECCGPIELVPKEGHYVCWNCGLVKDNYFIVQEEEPHRSGGKPFGSQSSYTYKKYRPYKPLTHFREHFRRYTGQRFQTIPTELLHDLRPKVNPRAKDAYWQVKTQLKKLKGKKYVVKVWNKEMRRYDAKKYTPQKFYKDIFCIIYDLGGYQPKVDNVNEIFQAYQNLQYQFLQLKRKHETSRSNMPSHFMLLDILLRKHGHSPYYEIPYLKDKESREKVIQIFKMLNYNVFQDHGIIEDCLSV